MVGSLFSGLSGVRSYQMQLEVIGNNISNTNTIGFKGGRAIFNDIFSQTLRSAKASSGGFNPQQSGRGVKVGSVDTIFTQGSLQSTNKNTDMAIVGNGFFILGEGVVANASHASDGSNQYFTRAGAFDVEADGYLIGSNGLYVQGKTAVNSVIPTGGTLRGVRLPINEKLPPKATTTVTLKANLDARMKASTKIQIASVAFTTVSGEVASLDTKLNEIVGADKTFFRPRPEDKIVISGTKADGLAVNAEYTYADGNTLQSLIEAINKAFDGTAIASLVDGKIVLQDATPGKSFTAINLSFVDQGSNSSIKLPSFNTIEGTNAQNVDTIFKVFDSSGNTHTVTITFKPEEGKGAKGQGGTWSWKASIETVDATIVGGGSGTVTFNPDGSLALFSYDDKATALSFNPQPPTPFIKGDGADKVSIVLDVGLAGKFDGITSFPSDSTLMAPEQDGYAAGTLESFNIDDAGVIHGVFSNGVTQVLAQLALANFSNPAGLVQTGENLFQTSQSSGQAIIGPPGTEGLGRISSGSLELSNVALVEEFINMILAQRGFQANANVITTTDTILGDIINLKRG